MVYIDEPHIPTVDKLKVAWDIVFRSEASMIKLFFSNLLLYILVFAVMFVIMIGLGLISAFVTNSPAVILTLFIISGLLALIVTVWISYLIVGSRSEERRVGKEYLDHSKYKR